MSVYRKIDIPQLLGRNGGPTPTNIGDGEWAELQNFLSVENGRIRRRPGLTRLTTSAYSERLTSLHRYNTEGVGWKLVAGTLTGLATLGSGVLTVVPLASGLSVASSTSPWIGVQYKGILYFARKNTGALKRFDGSNLGDAGIAAPATAPVLADGGAGDIEVGDYKAVYTYYNSSTGAESNPSPASNVLSIAASHRIDWSAIASPTNPQVDKIRLYRTLPDQTEEYFFVDEVSIVTTTYEDNDAIADLGDPVSFRHGLPPDLPIWITVFNEHLFMTDGENVYFSEPGSPEGFAASSLLPIFPDDGAEITAVIPFGSRLIVPKTNAVHYIYGTDRATFGVRTLDDKNPCPSPWSMASTSSGILFWFTGKKVVYSTGGAGLDASTPEVEDVLNRVTPAAYERVHGSISTATSTYYLDLPLDGATEPTHTLAYNYSSQQWSLHRYFGDTVGMYWSGAFNDEDGEEILYSVRAADNYVYDRLSGVRDHTTQITAMATSKAFSSSVPGMKIGLRRIALLIDPAVDESISVKAYRNLSATAHKTRTVSLAGEGWKNINLSTLDQLSSVLQIGLSYTGDDEIEIASMSMRVLEMARYGRIL